MTFGQSKSKILKALLRKVQSFAIDFVNISSYRKEENERDTIRSKARQGTSRFYDYVSIYLILKNKRYTLAVKYIQQGESLTDTIDFLIKEVEQTGFKIKEIYLDREFFTVEVINYLPKGKYLLPCCVLRGRCGSIRNLFVGRKSCSTEYTMHYMGGEAAFQTHILVKYYRWKYNREGVKYFAYAVYDMDTPVKRMFKEYRKRFGIE